MLFVQEFITLWEVSPSCIKKRLPWQTSSYLKGIQPEYLANGISDLPFHTPQNIGVLKKCSCMAEEV